MFKFLSRLVADRVTQEVNTSLVEQFHHQDKKLNMVIEHLEKLRFELSSLDQRLTQKELKDKTDYGQMSYRISAIQNDLRNNSSN